MRGRGAKCKHQRFTESTLSSFGNVFTANFLERPSAFSSKYFGKLPEKFARTGLSDIFYLQGRSQLLLSVIFDFVGGFFRLGLAETLKAFSHHKQARPNPSSLFCDEALQFCQGCLKNEVFRKQ